MVENNLSVSFVFSKKKSSTKRKKISFYNNQLMSQKKMFVYTEHMHITTIYCMSVYITNIIFNNNV
jgi:uncharacterized protein YegJ (DUF2314 family)